MKSTRSSRLLSVLLCMAMVLIVLVVGSVNVMADDDPVTGLTYNISEGEAEITGFTAPTDFDGELEIPALLGGASVTKIADHAFSDYTSLQKVEIPSGVTNIGANAFAGCVNLSAAYFYGDAPTMGSDVFVNAETSFTIYYLSEKTGFTNPWNGYTSATFGDIAVTGVSLDISSATITVGENVQLTATVAPDDATNKAVVWSVFSESGTNIATVSSTGQITANNPGTAVIRATSVADDTKFTECNVTVPAYDFSYTISEGKATITGLTALTGFDGIVVIPDMLGGASVASIGDWAFNNCKTLTSVTIPSSMTIIGRYVFSHCTSLTSITIPDSVTSIGGWAFWDCTSLIVISIPDSVTSIGNSAFLTCSSLTTVTIPSKVTSIEYDTFLGCASLTSFTIPSSVTSINFRAFFGCSRMESITILGNVTSIGTSSFYTGSYRPLTFIVPNGLKTYYEDNLNAAVLSGTTAIIIDVFTFTTGLDYTILDGVATITGFTAPEGFDGILVIPDIIFGAPVTSIGDDAFYDCTSLTSITIPDSVTSIGMDAFEDCSNLTSIMIPDSVTSIGVGAFYNCISLTDITIPNSVTSIEEGTFNNCASLTDITIPNSVTSIGEGAFYSCASLTYITIPYSVVSIGQFAFAECTSLSVVTFNGTVANIGTNAFSIGSSEVMGFIVSYGQRTYYEGILSEDVMSGTSVFLSEIHTDVRGLTYLIFDDGATIIDFSAPTGFDGVLAIPDTIGGKSVTAIGDWVFADYINLTEIAIPSSVTSIGEGAFDGCTSLIGIAIPDGVTSIGDWTFYGCTSLPSITMPDGVAGIGESAFNGCTSLTEIAIPSSVMSIGDWAFSECTNITAVTIPSGVTSIGFCTFSECTSLTSITIPNTVTSIGDMAFFECTSLTSITIPNSVTSIAYGAFSGCTGLTAIIVPNSVTSLGNWVFDRCSSLTSVTIPSSVTNIGTGLFYECSSLTNITIPSSVISIGDGAFAYCDSLVKPVFEGEKPIFGLYVYDDCAADIEIYYHISHAASWEEYTDYPMQPYCFVSFNLQDGRVTEKLFTEVNNDPIAEPVKPIRAHYDFHGWYKEAACTNAWNFENDRVSKDTTLYAKWTRVTYVISVTTNNTAYGKVTGDGTYYANAYVSLFATPNAGYRFIGWKSGTALVTTSAAYYFNADTNSAYTAEFEMIGTPSLYATSAGYTGIQLTWSSVSGASWYEIYRSPSAGGTFTLIATTGSSSYIDYGRTTNVNYYYQVRVCCNASTATTFGSYSNVASAKPVPAAPTVLLSQASYNRINVTWSPVPGAIGYKLYRSTSLNGTYALIITTSRTSYSNYYLKTGTTYYYKVRAYGTFGGLRVYGDYSTVASLMPKLGAVSVATATPYYPTSIKVTWNAVAGRSYYEVWRSTSPGSGFELIARTYYTYFRNTGRTPNTTYYYMIRAYRVVSGIKIYSEFSPVVSATPTVGTLTGAKAIRSNATTIKISWSAVTGRTKYEIWGSTEADGEYVFLKETTLTYNYQYGLTTGTPYYYKIRAYRLIGVTKYYGNFSTVASATP